VRHPTADRQLFRFFLKKSIVRCQAIQTWAWGAIQQVFGRSSLAGAGVRPTEGRDAEDLRRVLVPAPKIPKGATGAELDKALVGSYVETSMSLSDALDGVRQERDEAQRRRNNERSRRGMVSTTWRCTLLRHSEHHSLAKPCSSRPHFKNSRSTRSTTGRSGPCCRTKRVGQTRSSSSRCCSTSRYSGDSRGRLGL
jgi:hypothetical protein